MTDQIFYTDLMAFFKTNDQVAINYQLQGNPTGQTIIFVEGYSGNEATWCAQISDFIQAGFRVLTYDRRNHGHSQTVPFGMQIARHGMDLAELIAKLNLKKPILIGHSMGAGTIFAYLSLFGCNNIQALVTEDQSPKGISDDNWPFGLFNANWQNFSKKARLIATTKLTRLTINDDIKRALGLAYSSYQPFDFQFNYPLLIDSLVQDWRPEIKNETVRHLFLAGSASPLWSCEHAKSAASLNPLAEDYVFQGAGHIPHLESPKEFNQLVINFIHNNNN